MIKKLVASFIMIVVTIVFVGIAYAEMAKEGSGEYRSSKISTLTVLPMGNERLQMNYEQIGVVVAAPENSPLYNASFRCIGTLHAVKGKYISSGSIIFTNINDDKVFATFEAEGILKGASKSTVIFIGGTGACTGIQGTLDVYGNHSLKSSKKGKSFGISEGKFNWKIP